MNRDPVIVDLRRFEAEKARAQHESELIDYYANEYLMEEKANVIQEISHGLLMESVNERLPDDPPYGAIVLMHYLNGDDRRLGKVVRDWMDGYVEREAWARAQKRAEQQVDDERERKALGITDDAG